MKPRIPWLRIFVEGVVIVGSILLAFGIDAWWDGRQERAEESELLAGLLAEFKATRPQLSQRLDMMERMARNGAVLRDLVASEAGSPSVEVPDSLITGVISAPTYQPALSTLDAAVASGQLEIIRSSEIREVISRWRTSLRYVTTGQEGIQDITETQVVPLVARDVALGPYYSGRLEPGGHGSLRPTLELSGAIALRQSRQGRLTIGLSNLLESLDRLVVLLDAELDGR